MKENLVWKDETSRYISKNHIVGNFSMWAIRQSPYDLPDNFVKGIQEFADTLVDNVEFDDLGLSKITCKDLRHSICNTIKMCKTILNWSEPKNPSTSKYIFVSREFTPEADDDCIDVYALSRNVAYGCWLELCYDGDFFEINRGE